MQSPAELFYTLDKLGGRRGTIDDVAKISFPLSLSSSDLRLSPNSIPVYSLMLSSHLFFCLTPFLAPFTVPCRIAFAMAEDLEMWQYHLSFRFFTMVRRSSCTPVSIWILLPTSSFVTIESNLKGLHPSLEFCCQGLAIIDHTPDIESNLSDNVWIF